MARSRTFGLVGLPILSAFLAGAMVAQIGAAQIGFPIQPRIASANPAIRHDVVVHIPAKLKVVRTSDKLAISLDPDSPQIVTLSVGKDMVTGFTAGLRVYPAGTGRPAESGSRSVSSSIADFGSSTGFVTVAPGTEYMVEEEVVIFETDIPAQHFWRPEASPSYKVLWRGVVETTVQ